MHHRISCHEFRRFAPRDRCHRNHRGVPLVLRLQARLIAKTLLYPEDAMSTLE
jgi:hypothetical protein